MGRDRVPSFDQELLDRLDRLDLGERPYGARAASWSAGDRLEPPPAPLRKPSLPDWDVPYLQLPPRGTACRKRTASDGSGSSTTAGGFDEGGLLFEDYMYDPEDDSFKDKDGYKLDFVSFEYGEDDAENWVPLGKTGMFPGDESPSSERGRSRRNIGELACALQAMARDARTSDAGVACPSMLNDEVLHGYLAQHEWLLAAPPPEGSAQEAGPGEESS